MFTLTHLHDPETEGFPSDDQHYSGVVVITDDDIKIWNLEKTRLKMWDNAKYSGTRCHLNPYERSGRSPNLSSWLQKHQIKHKLL